MIGAIRTFFERNLKPAAGEPDFADTEHRLRLATAALLFEVMRMDEVITAEERRVVLAAVREKFGLSDTEAGELMDLAETEAAEAVGYYGFTSLINERFNPDQKARVVEYLWQVAFADGHLDKHEEYMVRKLADLLYVPHRDFIAAKHRARDAMKG